MPGWDTAAGLLREEVRQRRDEGCVVPEELAAAVDRVAVAERLAAERPAADGPGAGMVETRARAGVLAESRVAEELFAALEALGPDRELETREPNDLDAIRALRPDGPRDLGWAPSDAELVDRLHGAWTGRCVGCALGKPVELLGLAIGLPDGLTGRAAIRRRLEALGDWPLRDYFSGADAGAGLELTAPASQREQVAFMEPDDDINYTLAALGVLEDVGPGFAWDDVARWWLAHIPLMAFCTAEAQAVLTLQEHSQRGFAPTVGPDFTRRHRNPYREWIGAQIRSEGWGWANAGRPEAAAAMAWRDASWTHERNGVYGAMLFAAIHAAAFVERDPVALVEIGLSEIPARSRLAVGVRECLAWTRQTSDWERVIERVEGYCGDMSPVHTINNAMVCVVALVCGHMDPAEAVSIAVSCGLDTDCNGATVGAITGAAAGRARYPGVLADRLQDTIHGAALGFEDVRMADLARRTATVWEKTRGLTSAVALPGD